MYYLILLTYILTSCGSDSSKEGAKGQTPNAQTAPSATSETPSASNPVSTSYFVATESELKACDDSTRGFLAYVEDSKTFTACLKSGWSKVDVKGKDGTSGKDGEKAYANDNTWKDPVTSKIWVIGTTFAYTVSGPRPVCSAGYTFPRQFEVEAAVVNGLSAVAQRLNSNGNIWAPTIVSTTVGIDDKFVYIKPDSSAMLVATSNYYSFPVAATFVCYK